MDNDIAARGEEIAAELERTSTRIDEFQRKLSEERVNWRSSDRLFTVVVDGNGRLLDLDIASRALDIAQPERAGPKIVQAIQEARAAAVDIARKKWKEEFGSTQLLDNLLPGQDEHGR